jgi:AraC-like DNA-binding protein
VKRALLLMESNIQEKVSVSEIANRLGFSRRQLERLFSAERYQPNGCLSFAAHTLCQIPSGGQRLDVSEVGFRCGFSNAGHFIPKAAAADSLGISEGCDPRFCDAKGDGFVANSGFGRDKSLSVRHQAARISNCSAIDGLGL